MSDVARKQRESYCAAIAPDTTPLQIQVRDKAMTVRAMILDACPDAVLYLKKCVDEANKGNERYYRVGRIAASELLKLGVTEGTDGSLAASELLDSLARAAQGLRGAIEARMNAQIAGVDTSDLAIITEPDRIESPVFPMESTPTEVNLHIEAQATKPQAHTATAPIIKGLKV